VSLGVRKTVIELDGPVHENNLEYDQFRDSEMVNLGLHILRIKKKNFWNAGGTGSCELPSLRSREGKGVSFLRPL
jgi:hypothetical protein